MIKKWQKWIMIQLSLMLTLTACGKEAEDVGADITLLEPVGAVLNYETVAYRNIYDVQTFSGGVYPVVTEYAYEGTQKFDGYSVLPGEEVKKGDILLEADTTALDELIADKEEALAEKEAAHLEYVADMQADIAKAEEERVYREEGMALLDAENPDSVYVLWQGLYRMAAYNEEMLIKELEQTTTLYELEYAYEAEQLESLKAERNKAVLVAEQNGTVVSVGYYDQGGTIQATVPVIAIADLEEKIVKCNYISPLQANKADSICAYIGGERYELVYQKMDNREYEELKEAGMAMYSTFLLVGDTSNLEVGDAATVVLEFNSSEEVVSVSRSAVRKDETGSFVYVNVNGENVHTPVQTGLSDGIYIEIVSGLSVGDKVLAEAEQQYFSQTEVLESGTYSVGFGGRGYMYYPDATYVHNELEYGTVFFTEYHVSRYQEVKKGDVIATIRVEGDNAKIVELETQLLRLEERLLDYQTAWEEEYSARDFANETKREKESWQNRREAYDKEVARRTEAIAEIRELIAEMQADYTTTKIVAHRSGIVTWMSDYSKEEVIKQGAAIACIADVDSSYLMVENTNQILNYGTELEIRCTTWTDDGEETLTVPGMVVSVANPGVSSDLYSDYAIVKFMEPLGDIAMSYLNDRGEWRRIDFKVTGTALSWDNVVMVPNSAVTNIDGHMYVNVVQEDGNIVARSFVAGGNDLYNYWVIDGLEEGMTVCYE